MSTPPGTRMACRQLSVDSSSPVPDDLDLSWLRAHPGCTICQARNWPNVPCGSCVPIGHCVQGDAAKCPSRMRTLLAWFVRAMHRCDGAEEVALSRGLHGVQACGHVAAGSKTTRKIAGLCLSRKSESRQLHAGWARCTCALGAGELRPVLA